LVLLAVEIGRLAATASPNRTPIISKYWIAALQPVITTLGGVGRFFCNELRPLADGSRPRCGSAGWYSLFGGGLCYCAAFIIWTFTSWVQIDNVGSLGNLTGTQLDDGVVVYVVVIAQLGYSLVAFGSVAILNICATDPTDASRRLPGNMYSPNLSFAKDFAFSFLDLTTKFGLAFYTVVVRSVRLA